MRLPLIWMTTPSSAPGAGAVDDDAADALTTGAGVVDADTDAAGVDAAGADVVGEVASGCASLLPHAKSTAPSITHTIGFIIGA